MDTEGIDLKTFKEVFEKGNLFASGCAVEYAPSRIVARPQGDRSHKSSLTHAFKAPADGTLTSTSSFASVYGKQDLAKEIPIGMRIPSHKVLNQADARPWHLQELLPSNGAWRILVFAGDISVPQQFERYQKLGKALDSDESFFRRFQPRDGDATDNPVFEILTIHSAPRTAIELHDLPEIFHPFSGEYGWDYAKVYVDDVSYHEGHGKAYENYGIDSTRGCAVVVRPDQYVSWIGELEDVEDLNTFFDSFMKVQS